MVLPKTRFAETDVPYKDNSHTNLATIIWANISIKLNAPQRH